MKSIKSTVVEVDQDRAIVLTENGEFLTCSLGTVKEAPQVGTQWIVNDRMAVSDDLADDSERFDFLEEPLEYSEMEFKRMQHLLKKTEVSPRGKMSWLATAAVVLMAFGGSWLYPWQQLYLEVNPSLVMTYNLYHRVVKVEGQNEDGVEVAKSMSSYGGTIESAVADSVHVMTKAGYLKANGGVLVGYAEAGRVEQIEAEIEAAAAKDQVPVTIATIEVTKATVTESEKLETSPIRLSIVKKTLSPEAQKQYEANPETVKEAVEAMQDQKTIEVIKTNAPALKIKPPKENKNPVLPKVEPAPVATTVPVEPTTPVETIEPVGDQQPNGGDTNSTESPVASAEETLDGFGMVNEPTQKSTLPKKEVKLPLVEAKPPKAPKELPKDLPQDPPKDLPGQVPENGSVTEEIQGQDQKIVLEDQKKAVAEEVQKNVQQLKAAVDALKLPEDAKNLPLEERRTLLKQRIKKAMNLQERLWSLKVPTQTKENMDRILTDMIQRYEKLLKQMAK